MFTTNELLEASQRLFPLSRIRKVQGNNYLDVEQEPLDGLSIRIKPDSFGLFQVRFPFENTAAYQKMNDYKMLDAYFKKQLKHSEAGKFICQISTNKLIYVYPKHGYDLQSCMRVLEYVVNEVKNAASIVIRQDQQHAQPAASTQKSVRQTIIKCTLFSFLAMISMVYLCKWSSAQGK
jgi:hypothetical protein